MREVWPLAGRAEEFDEILSAMRGSGLALAGEAGVGKTRLAREALAVLEQAGVQGRWVAATESSRIVSLGAFAPWIGEQADPAMMMQSIADNLVGGSHRQRVVVVVDDAHLLDDVSATLLHQLVLRGAVTALVTLRTEMKPPDAVAALWKDELLQRMELAPLSPDAVHLVLEAALGGPVDRASAGRIAELTQGIPLFLRHLVDGELDAGRLRRSDGLWIWSGEPAVSPVLAELVAAHMGGIPEMAREAIDILAVAEPLGVEQLGSLTGALSIEHAEDSGLVRVSPDVGGLVARLAHPLYGEVRRRQLGDLRSRRLRGEVARTLQSTMPDHPLALLRYALLRLDSDLAPDPELFASAAQVALSVGDVLLTERLAGAAVDAGGGFNPLLVHATALTWLGRPVEAEKELAVLTEMASSDDELAEVAWPRVNNLRWNLRRGAEASALLAWFDGQLTDTAARRMIAALRAMHHGIAGEAEEAVAAATATLSAPSLSDAALISAIGGAVIGLSLLGRADELEALSERAYGHEGFSAVLTTSLSEMHGRGLLLAGYLEKANTLARERARETASALGVASSLALSLTGQVEMARGRVRTAARCLRGALPGIADVTVRGWDYITLIPTTLALAMAGDAAAARRSLDDLELRHHPALAYLAPEEGLARAWVNASEGVMSDAIGLAWEAAEMARRRGQVAYEVLALHSVTRFGDGAAAGRLADVAPRVDGPLPPLAARHAMALARSDATALSEVSGRFEELGYRLLAADAAAQAAKTHANQGRTGSAHLAVLRAQTLATMCEGARTPALAALTTPPSLTPREREIVTLAAQGLTNRAIAERLFVAVRTVEGHLYRAGAKLGISDRAGFAELIEPPAAGDR